MTCITVKTQRELDDALRTARASGDCIHIESEPGVWLCLSDSGSATVEATGSATVRASGSATVRASDSATVEAWGSATVEATGSATVRATGSATVRAWGSATVRATGSATVRASGSATVEATPHVAVHLHSARARITGGTLIDVTKVYDTADAWLHHHGVDVVNGKAILYKAVLDDWTTRRGDEWTYRPGATVTARDWRDDRECGGGLHFSPRPFLSRTYLREATRFVAVEVDMATLRPIPGGGAAKCKAPSCRVLHEVDIDGNALEAEARS